MVVSSILNGAGAGVCAATNGAAINATSMNLARIAVHYDRTGAFRSLALRCNVVPSVSSVATLEHVLSEYWGYTSFRPLQREAMTAILDGRDSLVVLPTGGGKSLCFQAPALVDRARGGLGLVVSPLISLMKDQVDGLVESGVEAACYNSALA